MKILHLIPSLVGGGAERQLAYLAQALRNRGVEVHVGFVHGGPNLARLHDSGIDCHRITTVSNHDPFIAAKLFALMGRLRPDLVQTWLLQMDVFGGMAALARRLPWVVSERSSALMYGSYWKYRLRQRIAQHSSMIVANSNAGLEYWGYSAVGRRGRVIRNVIPFEELAARSQVPQSSVTKRPLVVIAGRYSEEKNLLVLLEALDRVFARLPAAQAMFFGAGPMRGALERTRDRLPSAGRIEICDYTDNLAAWLSNADAYVSVSRFEGNPNTVLEAMACGCPVVASDIAAHREILDESLSRLVPCDSVSAIAAAIADVLNDSQAARLRATKARKTLHRYDADTICREYLDLYFELTGKD